MRRWHIRSPEQIANDCALAAQFIARGYSVRYMASVLGYAHHSVLYDHLKRRGLPTVQKLPRLKIEADEQGRRVCANARQVDRTLRRYDEVPMSNG